MLLIESVLAMYQLLPQSVPDADHVDELELAKSYVNEYSAHRHVTPAWMRQLSDVIV